MKPLTLSFVLILLLMQSAFGQQALFSSKKDTILLKRDQLKLPNQFFRFDDLPTQPFIIYHDNEKQLEIEGMKYFNPSQDYYRNGGEVCAPQAIRFYQNTEELDTITGMDVFKTHNLGKKQLPEYFKPFYFKTYEVTNKEYKEFVEYVKDSLIRCLLDYYKPINGQDVIDWEKKYDLENKDTQELIAELYLPEHERFYVRKGFDYRKFNYRYHSDTGYSNINICPDTLSWVHDFTWSYNEPMTQNYFWHPHYDDYPVVGVNYHQAQAFCHWKSIQLSKKYGKQIKVELPSEIEWNYACTYNQAGVLDGAEKLVEALEDNNWLTDLKLIQLHGFAQVDKSKHPNGDEWNINHLGFSRKEILHGELTNDVTTSTNPFSHTYGHTSPADLSRLTPKSYLSQIDKHQMNRSWIWTLEEYSKRGIPAISKKEYKLLRRTGLEYDYNIIMQNLDKNGISGLGGNVSEWLVETYEDNWKPLFELRQKMFFDLPGSDATILALMERHYNYTCHKKGQLVRGANWFDERYSSFYGKNKAGMNAKNFADPNKGYATVGFRYVIRMD